jgi:HSP20 family protein
MKINITFSIISRNKFLYNKMTNLRVVQRFFTIWGKEEKVMIWRRRHPFGWRAEDLEEMMGEMENVFWGGRMLPPGGITDRMLPAIRGEFRVDVREHDDEVIVVADLPGVEKDDISLNLVSPNTLEIDCERKGAKEEEREGYYMRERMYGSMKRMVTLPRDVEEAGSSASFKNGVLEVRLKKSEKERGKRILIE